ncbi:exonuclease [Symbioplanes lichenis]|uniref:exonuclease n=1 Tax=Symbioplanes lichenis TaxID=1629072 RepID=UPI0027385A2F|nr:exonuclease [Actinoplanes lichenis]
MAVDLYIAVRVAADGPVPGPYSMLALGMATAGTFDGTTFTRHEPTTFHCELQPISAGFVPETLAATGLDRAGLARTGTAPAVAMRQNAAWLAEQAGRHDARPVLAGRTLGHDWMFTSWYHARFGTGSPLGTAAHLDLTTLYALRAGRPLHAVTGAEMTERLLGHRAPASHVLDDALEQAALLSALL